MDEHDSWPKYRDNLGSFLGDLRSSIFASQSQAARHLQLSHTTISRYENGRLLPPPSYLAYLAYLIDERLSVTLEDAGHRQGWLLREINEALRWNYGSLSLYVDWNAVRKIAQSYLLLPSDERRPDAVQTRHVDWGDAPDVATFYGRETELAQLQDFIVTVRCRFVLVAGMGGIGKTLTVSKLAREIESDFRYTIWRSLRNAPAIQHTIQELSTFLLASTDAVPSQSLDQQILRLLEFMQAHRCLVVLDNLESIMGTGDDIGGYQAGYENYRAFFNTIATTQHQSCLLLTSREVPAHLATLVDARSVVRTYHLAGLTAMAAERILLSHNVVGSADSLRELTQLYSGNPMALKLVAEMIVSVFGGDVVRFLAVESAVFNDIRHLLSRSFERLSVLACDILYWLAIERQPITLDKLASRLVPRCTAGVLVDTMHALQRCSLVERIDSRFYIPNVVSEYLIDRLVHALYQDVSGDDLLLFHRIALLTADAQVYVRQTQFRLIVKPLADALVANSPAHAIKTRFERLLQLLRLPAYAMTGYGPGNLLNVMVGAGRDLHGYDFSGLTIQHTDLTNVSLAGVDFSGCILITCLFDNTFIGINTVALSRHAQFLALACGAEIRIWRLWDRQPHRILTGHSDMVWSLIFARDELHIFSRDAGDIIHRWNVDDARIELSIQHPLSLSAMALSPDETVLATGSDDGIVFLWDARSGELQQTLNNDGGSAIRVLTFGMAHPYLAAGEGSGKIILWDVAQGTQITELQYDDHAITSLSFTREDKALISSGAGNTIRVWDIEAFVVHATLSGHGDVISAIKAHPNGKLLASSSYDRTIKLWDMAHQEPQFVLLGHELPVSAIDLDETGNVLVSGSYDRTVRIWDTRSGRLIDSIHGLTFDLRTLDISADSQFIAAGSSDYHSYVWDIHSGNRLQTYKGHVRWIASICFDPTSDMLATGSYDRTVRLWSLQHNRELAVLTDHSHWVICVCFSMDGTFLASGSMDRTIRIWSMDSRTCVATLRGHENAVNCIAFHPHRPLVASGSRDKTVRLWDIERGETAAVMPTVPSMIETLQFSEDGLLLLGVTRDGRLMSWDIAAGGTLTDEWQFTNEPVQVCALSIDGRRLAFCGMGRTFALWEIASRRKLLELPAGGKISSLAFDRQALCVASGSIDGRGNVWEITTGHLVRSFKMDRPYEGMDITETAGISDAQREMLKSLGAIDRATPNI